IQHVICRSTPGLVYETGNMVLIGGAVCSRLPTSEAPQAVSDWANSGYTVAPGRARWSTRPSPLYSPLY
ncbi:MAG: hypothetical protein AAFP90_16195, partial [Planctomycetota bacterium]